MPEIAVDPNPRYVPELTDVRALTLLNPWGHLIAHGSKRVENRSWMPPESLDRFFVHAGKGWDDGAEALLRSHGIDVAGVQPSAIVAVADLAHGCNTSRWSRDLRCGCGEWAMPGQCHWVLGKVWTLSEPVPCRGAQGLWRPPVEVVEAVRIQLAADVAAAREQSLA